MKKIMMTACVAILAAQGAALGEGAALVIGNGDYRHAPRAISAEADARAVANKLEAAGYDVTLGLDLTRVQMRAAMDEFARDAEGEDDLVVFYSGHAMRMEGRTFLSPVDFDPVGAVAVAFDSAPFEALQSLTGNAENAVIFIDGAQLDGFDASEFAEPGISPISVGAGAAVVSAAAPGWAIRRSGEGQSKFGRAIVNNFLSPGADFEDAIAVSGDAVWTAGAAEGFTIVNAEDVTTTAAPKGGSEVELAFWRSAESGGEVSDYKAYLAAYPDGIFASIARNRLAAAGAEDTSTAEPPAPETNPAEDAENALNLSRSERLSIQRDLTTLGYDTRGVDGVFGRGTRGALRSWQESERLAATGYTNRRQIAQLRDDAARETARIEKERAEQAALTEQQARVQERRFWQRTQEVGTTAAYERYLSRYPDGPNATQAKRALQKAREATDRADWEEARRMDTASAYDRYLDLHPRGQFADRAQRRLEARQGVNTSREEAEAWRRAEADDRARTYREFVRAYPNSRFADEAERRASKIMKDWRERREANLNLSGGDWQSLEQRLDFLGFRVGRIDGRPDGDLRRAILEYRRSRGLDEHEYVDQPFVDTILKETSGASPTGQLLNKLFQKLREN